MALKPKSLIALVAVLAATPAFGATVDLSAAKDNTLYEVTPDGTTPSNALGELMFAGASGVGDIRRAIIAFDLTSIPSGSTIQAVTLTLYNSSPRTNSVPVSLHRVLADWGEGSSDATGSEGRGVPATPGDATWLHRFFPDATWKNAGGDYAPGQSAAQPVPAAGYFAWTGPGLVADVQAWVDDPPGNFGWVLIGDESTPGSMKWFATRENGAPQQHPVLTVEYTPALPTQQKTWGGVKALYQKGPGK
jgi:hypothetical protein